MSVTQEAEAERIQAQCQPEQPSGTAKNSLIHKRTCQAGGVPLSYTSTQPKNLFLRGGGRDGAQGEALGIITVCLPLLLKIWH